MKLKTFEEKTEQPIKPLIKDFLPKSKRKAKATFNSISISVCMIINFVNRRQVNSEQTNAVRLVHAQLSFN